MKKKFEVHYSLYFSDSVEIEAKTEEEARAKCEEMLVNDEIGVDMCLGEQKVWID